jgi:hypothetical protein
MTMNQALKRPKRNLKATIKPAQQKNQPQLPGNHPRSQIGVIDFIPFDRVKGEPWLALNF